MPSTGSVLGLTAKLGLETDESQVKRETKSLKNKLSEAAEAEMTADTKTLKNDIVNSIEEASEEARWMPDLDLGSQSLDESIQGGERGRISQQLGALGQNIPGQFGGPGATPGPQGGGAGGMIGEAFAGMKGAGGKFLKVGLAGAVGFGILSKVTSLADSAPRMQKVMSMMSRSVGLFARPLFDFVATFLEGGAKNILEMAANFNSIYAEDGLMVALGSLPEIFFTRNGEASRTGTAGRIIGGLGGMAGGAWAGAKMGLGAGGALGSIIPGAGTAAGGTAGAILGGLGGGLAGLLGGAGLGEWGAEGLKDATTSFVDGLQGMEPSTWGSKIKEAGSDLASDFENGVSNAKDWIETAGTNVSENIKGAVDSLTDMDWSDVGKAAMEGIEMGWDLITWTGSLAWDIISWTGSVGWDVIEWAGSIGWSNIAWAGSIGWDVIKWTGSIGWDLISWSGSMGWDAIKWTGSLGWDAIKWVGSLGWDIINWDGSIEWSDINFIGNIDLSKYVWWSGENTSGNGGMAQGGLVTRPTQKLVGEAGPEVVAPFGEFMNAVNSPDRRFGGGTGGAGAEGSGVDTERIVEAIGELHREIKRLDPQVELRVDRKTLAEEEQKGRNRYENSRVVSR